MYSTRAAKLAARIRWPASFLPTAICFRSQGATSALSGTNTAPAEVSFTSEGETLVVTEKGTGLIDTFTVGDDGLAVR